MYSDYADFTEFPFFYGFFRAFRVIRVPKRFIPNSGYDRKIPAAEDGDFYFRDKRERIESLGLREAG